MGLKFKRFKAKLTWKTKERAPEVLCLKYQVYSEFTDPTNFVAPTASQTRTEHVVQDYRPINDEQTLQVNDSNQVEIDQNKNNGVFKLIASRPDVNQHEQVASPKGILKKKTAFDFEVKTPVDEDENKKSALLQMTEDHGEEERKSPVEEKPKSILKRNSEDESKKSALIFMTENHDDDEERKISVEEKPRSILKRGSETDDNLLLNRPEYEEVTTRQTDSENDESDEESKTVRWRNTIIEIQPPTEYVQMSTNENYQYQYDYPVHNNVEKHESEYEEVAESPRYRYSTVYSDQAASIFFAGEEPDASPRNRKVAEGYSHV